MPVVSCSGSGRGSKRPLGLIEEDEMSLGTLAEEPEDSGKHTAQRARHSEAGLLLSDQMHDRLGQAAVVQEIWVRVYIPHVCPLALHCTA